jgi:phage shock protein E
MTTPFQHLTIQQYSSEFKDSVPHTLVDVRTDSEFMDGHIPGAINIPLDELDARSDEVPEDQPVVVVCAHGMRSVSGSEILTRSGHTQVYNLQGGTAAWEARLPLE